MWKLVRSVFDFNKGKYLVYLLSGDEVIYIPINEEGHGDGVIYFKDSLSSHRKLKLIGFNQDGTKANHDSVKEDDLDVLKLLCLTRAKELGWDIKGFS